jgi:hypothetical protein
MADADKFRVFYGVGVQWATDNLAALRSIYPERAALAEMVHIAFNQEGFIESMFRSVRTYHLCQQNQGRAEEQFVAGVCDTICGPQSIP